MQCDHVLLCLFAMRCIVLYRSMLMFDVGSCFVLDVRCNFYHGLCYVVSDLFVAMFARILLVTIEWDCHADKSPLWMSIRRSPGEVQPLLHEGIFLVRQRKHHPCTSSLFTTLNAATYTILTQRPGDVVPLGRTPLSISYVANACYVPLIYIT